MCKPLFDTQHDVEERINGAGHVFLCLDYDGTLTHFVANPLAASLSQNMERVLKSLADREGITMAVISGRDRADLQGRVGIPGLIYAGNHGLDISGPGFMFVEHEAVERSAQLQILADRLVAKLQNIKGAIVENKGLTMSVHYRAAAADDWEEVERVVRAMAAGAEHAFVVTPAEKVWEIRPRVEWNKGTAVAWMRERLAAPNLLTIYVGDDTTDEDAFRAIGDGIAVKVRTAENTAARYQLENPAEVRKFLEWIDELLRHKHPMPAGKLVEA
jgi:trehalose 6-phosphate phosphatase